MSHCPSSLERRGVFVGLLSAFVAVNNLGNADVKGHSGKEMKVQVDGAVSVVKGNSTLLEEGFVPRPLDNLRNDPIIFCHRECPPNCVVCAGESSKSVVTGLGVFSEAKAGIARSAAGAASNETKTAYDWRGNGKGESSRRIGARTISVSAKTVVSPTEGRLSSPQAFLSDGEGVMRRKGWGVWGEENQEGKLGKPS